MSIAMVRRRALMNMVKTEETEGNPIVFNTNTVRGLTGLRMYGASKQTKTTGAQLIDKIVVGNVLKSSNEKVVCTITNEGLHIKTFSGVSTTIDSDIYFFGNNDSMNESGYEKCLEAGTYSISIDIESNFRCYVVAWRDSKSQIIADTIEKLNFTVLENEKLRIFIRPRTTTVFETVTKCIVNKGKTALPWELYTGGQPSPSLDYPQDWTNKGEIGQINTEIYGGNLCSGFLNNGNVKCASFLKYTGKITIAMRKKTGNKQVNCRFWYSNGTKGDDIAVLLSDSTNDTWVQTTKDVVDCTGISFYSAGSSVEENTGVEAIVKLGEYTITDYEPYKQPQSLIVQTPNGLPGIPVTSGGNYTDENGKQWVSDYVDFETGEYVKCVENVQFDGSENWIFDVGGNNSYRAHVTIQNCIYTIARNPVLCNRRIYTEQSNKDSLNSIFSSKGYIWLYGENAKESTKAQWIQELKDNPTYVLYQLEPPIRTPLSEEQIQAFKSLHTNSPTTTITNDSDVWMNAKYKVRS